MSKEVYVVTNPESGWDCVVGVFSDEEFVYSKYSSDRYIIHNKTVKDDKYMSIDIRENGRTDYKYKVIKVKSRKFLNDYEFSIVTKGGDIIESHTLLDSDEFEMSINNSEVQLNNENLSLYADLYCEHYKVSKENIHIYEYEGCVFLGSELMTEFGDDYHKFEKFIKIKGLKLGVNMIFIRLGLF